MEKEDQTVRHGSGIHNYYYGGVTKVINLKLTTEQLRAIGDSHVFNGSVGQFIDSVDKIIEGYGKSE